MNEDSTPRGRASDPLSPYGDLSTLNVYRGMWHAHIQGGFPGFMQARELCRRGNFSFVGLTEHDNRYPQIDYAEKEWYAAMDEEFLIIRGFEATHPMGHITCLGFLPEQTGVDAEAARRIRFEKVAGDAGYDGFLKTAAGLGAFLALNHPHRWRERGDELIRQPGFEYLDAMELYNGNQAGKSRQQGVTVDVYDACLSRGGRLWGAANPDCHSWDVEQHDGPFNGYSVVFAETLSRRAILDSLKRGRFYASTGLEVDELALTATSLRVAAAQCRRIRFFGRAGQLLESVTKDEATYRLRGDEGYVRAELVGHTPSQQSVSELTARAWLQPVWL